MTPASALPDVPGARRHFLLGCCGVAWLAGAVPAAAQGRSLTFGVVPQQSATELARGWVPVLALLAERSGIALQFATAPDIPSFEKRLAAGVYDLAYMNPYHYTVFSRRPGYRAIAREKGRRLRGIVVVRKDARTEQLAGLAGQEIAFPAPAAFAATVLVRAELARQRIGVTPRFVGSHESVYLNVARGLVPAGGGIQRTLEGMAPEVRDALRVLHTTQAYTPHAVAAHPRVPAPQVQTVLQAMLGLADEPRGREALKTIGFSGLEAGRDADWDDVRALGIQTLASLLRD